MSFLGRCAARAYGFKPSRRSVITVTAAAAAAITTLGAVNVATARTEVTLEVDGVSIPVTTWYGTTAGVLATANIDTTEHDRIQPALTEAVNDGDTVVVRTAHPYPVIIDGQERTVWSTSDSAAEILAEAERVGENISILADRSASRGAAIPLVSTVREITVETNSGSAVIEATPGINVREVLDAGGVDVAENDRVTARSVNGDLRLEVKQVERGETVRSEEIPFTSEEVPSDELFVGEVIYDVTGVAGRIDRHVWRETIDGLDTHVVELSETRALEPVKQVLLTGTKEVTPENLIAAGIDPQATLEEGTEEDGRKSVRLRAKLGTISSSDEIMAALGEDASPEATAAAMAAGVPLVYSGEDPKAIAQAMVTQRGWNDSQFQCLVTLWQRESNWNPYAENPSSGAYGIPQSLPASKMASAGADYLTNPATQITWGLGYIAGRYGTPCSALAHSNSVGWY